MAKMEPDPGMVVAVLAAIMSGPAGAAYLVPNMSGGASLNVRAALDDAIILTRGVIKRCTMEAECQKPSN